MSDEEYEGWSNRETWAVNLHLSNDQGLYQETNDRIKQALREADEDADQTDLRNQVAEALKTWVTDELLSTDYWRDEMGRTSGLPEGLEMMRAEVGSLWRVDWYEIADGWLEGVELD